MKALVVDDSAVMRKVLTGALARAEITDVDQAEDGQVAVDKASAADYDLILMDWNMPRLTGLEALKQIRAAGKNVPILMVTTEGEKERVVEAIKCGANGYILKPFEPAKIVEKIQNALASRG